MEKNIKALKARRIGSNTSIQLAKDMYMIDEEHVKQMKKYQLLYDAIYNRLHSLIMKELLSRHANTNTYLPKDWKGQKRLNELIDDEQQ